MATDAADAGTTTADADADTALSDHVRGVVVTSLASIAGIGAALASSRLTADLAATEGIGTAAMSPVALYVLAGAVAVQFPVLRLLGVDVGDFGAKDYLFVVFMTFSLWFVSWGILLNSGATV